MKVLVVGRGGREHVLAWKLSQSERVEQVVVAPGNDGMTDVAHVEPIEEHQHEQLIGFAKSNQIDLTIIGPEAPLMDGIVNKFQEEGLQVFGPTAEAAFIEGSKDFAKTIMQDYNIPTAKHKTFEDPHAAKAYIQQQGAPIVIKADGLAAGKGVTVAMSVQEAEQAVDLMLEDAQFGEAGSRVVIEEFLEGEEFSLMAFVNGPNVYPMVSSQDHKRAFDQDQGPNTGGMGAYSPVPQISQSVYEQAIQEILKPTAQALVDHNRSFTGILYAGLIATIDGPKVIEFNARFGDPEAQVILPRLQSDLVEVIENVLNEKPVELNWSQDSVVGVVLASEGYPGSYEKGKPIKGLEELSPQALTFHAGSKYEDKYWQTNGGRVLLVSAKGNTIAQAKDRVYEEMSKLDSKDVFYRKDIANKALQVL
ncbi:phosphoribosylamine--glycine ligase [Alkalibacillus haloalkaliphilus]|uniref:phosphoribosylamine--glycine ligase n=1 Tax=Alkalibacillus haloalkaliphilus TaxID=94136 RepID=UPI002935FD1A|nr:phosphoribosylamine--glycine ligase [Alkalibacillus haloalkaliphilus]MDV2582626.1 phosphoribosylamine--glycine ligase [Alkalibacillus haloalkaliphilus]